MYSFDKLFTLARWLPPCKRGTSSTSLPSSKPHQHSLPSSLGCSQLRKGLPTSLPGWRSLRRWSWAPWWLWGQGRDMFWWQSSCRSPQGSWSSPPAAQVVGPRNQHWHCQTPEIRFLTQTVSVVQCKYPLKGYPNGMELGYTATQDVLHIIEYGVVSGTCFF